MTKTCTMLAVATGTRWNHTRRSP